MNAEHGVAEVGRDGEDRPAEEPSSASRGPRPGQPCAPKSHDGGDGAPEPFDSADARAVMWRTTLQVAIRFHETPPELAEELWCGLRGRLWARLAKPDGSRYKEFHEFCETPQPHGLGTPHSLVNRLLVEIGNAREVKLLTVAPGCQGRRRDPAAASRHSGGKPSVRTTERLRAIAERSPASIQRLYTAGLIDQIDAEPFGRRQLPAERRNEITDFVTRVATPLAAKLEAGWTPPPAERRDLRRRVKNEIRSLFVVPRSSPSSRPTEASPRQMAPGCAQASARQAAGAGLDDELVGVEVNGLVTIESSQPLEPVAGPERPPRTGRGPAAGRSAPALPLDAEQAADLPLGDLIRCYWVVVRELFGVRLAALPDERWIHGELNPTKVCRHNGDSQRALRDLVERIGQAERATHRGQEASLRCARGQTTPPDPRLTRLWTKAATSQARGGVTRSS
jgi:hypothetical protein